VLNSTQLAIRGQSHHRDLLVSLFFGYLCFWGVEVEVAAKDLKTEQYRRKWYKLPGDHSEPQNLV
jgi:hypothetical protein